MSVRRGRYMPKATDPVNERYAYHDDPIHVQPSQGKKAPSAFFALLLLVVAATYFIQTTLASNISINSGSAVEFGQGVLQATACTGASQISITPHATFTNASPNGAFYFDSFSVSGIPDTCFGSDFTINGYQNSSDTPLALFNSTSTTPVIYDNAGTFQAGIGGTGLSVSGSSGAFTVVFSVPVALSTSLLKLTIQSGAHTEIPCAQGGSCSVGDRSPDGGIVYYVSVGTFASPGSTCNTACKYLEVAPATWRTGSIASDAYYAWSTNTTVLTGQDITTSSTEGVNANSAIEKTNWKIGRGFYNTSVMTVSYATSAAQTAVLAYSATDSSAGQWFLPSMNEINELCKYSRGQSTGDPKVKCTSAGSLKSGTSSDLQGFQLSYWSSTEWGTYGVWVQQFSNGLQGYANKGSSVYVRPVRAF